MFSAELTLFRIRLERWQWLLLILLGVAIAFLPPWLIPAAVIALAGGLIVLSEPLVGLALALFLGPLSGWEGVYIGGPIAAVTTGQIMLLLTFVAWFGRKLLRAHIPIPRTFLNFSLIAYVLMGLVTLWDVRSLVDGITELLKWVEILLISWILLDQTRRWPRRKVIYGLVALLLATASIQAFWGVFQFIIRGNGPGHFRIAGRLFRGTGSFMQPNPFGGYIALALSLAIGTLAGLFFTHWQPYSRAKNTDSTTALSTKAWLLQLMRTYPVIPLLAGVVGLLGFALIGSWSRGAWFNFLAALLVFTYLLPRSRERGVLFVVLGGSITVLAWNIGLIPPTLQNRLLGFLDTFTTIDVRQIALTPANFALVERLAHWQAGLNMAADSIWFGVGIGNYAAAYPEFMLPGWPHPLGHAHNIYINVFAEMGIWGLIAYAILWLPIFAKAIQLSRTLQWPLRGIAIGMLAGWVGLSVHHLLDNLYVNNNFFFLGVMFTILVMLDLEAEEAQN